MSTDPAILERTRALLIANPTMSFVEARDTATHQLRDEEATLRIEEGIDLANAQRTQDRLDAEKFGRVLSGEASEDDTNWFDDQTARASDAMDAYNAEAALERADWAKRVADAEKDGKMFDPSTMVRP